MKDRRHKHHLGPEPAGPIYTDGHASFLHILLPNRPEFLVSSDDL